MQIAGYGKQTVRAALLCSGCDLPGGKSWVDLEVLDQPVDVPVALKKFEVAGFTKDYSDFERAQWPKRTDSEHRRHVDVILQACSIKEKERLEAEYGCRPSSLLKLPCFDCIRMSSIVDPLHNLYLGTAKHVLKDVWLGNGMITRSQLEDIPSHVDNTITPGSVGRMPSKIVSNFGGFTGAQWKIWTDLFSLIALGNIITDEHYECWRHFVLASRIISSPALSTQKVLLADSLLMYFCKRMVRLYGQTVATPNMHMHSHLRECIEDFGPVQSFWLFSFERYNGILSRQPNNSRSVEIQVMRRFCRDTELMHFDLPSEFSEAFSVAYPLRGSSIHQSRII
jgi:hypothetical protein